MTHQMIEVEVLKAFEIFRHPHQELFETAGRVIVPAWDESDAVAFYLIGFLSVEGYPTYGEVMPLAKCGDQDFIQERVKYACDEMAKFTEPLPFLEAGVFSREGTGTAPPA